MAQHFEEIALPRLPIWHMSIPNIPPRSRLCNLAPLGLNRSLVESLTSYICRLAYEHHVEVGTLIQHRCSSKLLRRKPARLPAISSGSRNPHYDCPSPDVCLWHRREVADLKNGSVTAIKKVRQLLATELFVQHMKHELVQMLFYKLPIASRIYLASSRCSARDGPARNLIKRGQLDAKGVSRLGHVYR